MTNIQKITAEYNVQTHKAKKIVSLFKYLPYGYTSAIIAIAKKRGLNITSQQIRNVKGFIKFDIQVLNLLIEFAAQEKEKIKAAEKKLEELTK